MYLYGIEISQNGMKAKKLGSLNCTFMKLKSHNLFIASNLITCLNCTFMELKLEGVAPGIAVVCVLIVPLWN